MGCSRRRLLGMVTLGPTLSVAGCLSDDPNTLLALGDSYTVGTSIDHADRWVTRLPARLDERSIDLATPTVVAESGWTTADLATAIGIGEETASEESDQTDVEPVSSKPLDQTYDVVTLCIGANDALLGRSLPSFEAAFETLFEQAVTFADEDPDRVVVLTIPDYTVTPLGQRQFDDELTERLDSYNEIVETVATARGAALVDLVEPSRKVPDDPELVAGDDLHPSGKQHGLWLERITPAVAHLLSES